MAGGFHEQLKSGNNFQKSSVLKVISEIVKLTVEGLHFFTKLGEISFSMGASSQTLFSLDKEPGSMTYKL